MPISLQWEPHGVVRTMQGEVSMEEFMDSVAALHNDMRFDTLRFAIEDFSAVTSVQVSMADIDMVIAVTIGAAYSNPHIRIAAVTQLPMVKQMVTIFAKASPYITRQFEDMDAARAWIRDGDTSAVPLDIQLQAKVDFGGGQLVY